MMQEREVVIEQEFVTARQAAKILGVSPWVIYSLRARRGLRAYSVGGTNSLRFKVADLRAMMQPAEYVPRRPRAAGV